MVVQNNMFESGKCVMGITDADWTVMGESGRRRYEEGLTLAEGQHGKTSHREGLLELTWNYGTEKDESFKYHNGNDQPQGFGHICESCALQRNKKPLSGQKCKNEKMR
ncbi:hypothetical protein BB8028_0003g00700 [Beauveria bassiana]|uniref:Uncharacterized protein n=1 Tax=Beauveria bassiana TaxID=176275 RepID=A0A2S7Y5X8_BEABA|nr:hypothetical protein BB8028_0003g00700 [Beauveria bassiana]